MTALVIAWAIVGIPVCLFGYAVNGRHGLLSSITGYYVLGGLAIFGLVVLEVS
jgi:hypothetical protein